MQQLLFSEHPSGLMVESDLSEKAVVFYVLVCDLQVTTDSVMTNKICERARGAPHEHKLQASYFMGSTLGFVKMQCPQLAGAQTQGRCITCIWPVLEH